jgi:hypothetical protein
MACWVVNDLSRLLRMPMTTIKPIVLMRRNGAYLSKGDTDAEAFVLRGRAGGRRISGVVRTSAASREE